MPISDNLITTPEEDSLSWDHVQIPVPYKFHQDHVRLVNGPSSGRHNEAATFILDSVEKSSEAIDSLWKLGPLPPSIRPTTADNPTKSKSEDKETSSKPPGEIVLIDKIVYITVQQFIQSVIHLLSGRGSIVFVLKNGKFSKNPSLLVHGLTHSVLWNYSLPFVELGNNVRKLRQLGEYGDGGSGEFVAGTIVDAAFIKFASNYVKIFDTVLMVNFNTIHTFTELCTFIEPFRQQLDALHQIWFHSDKLPHDSVSFMNNLNWLLLSERSKHCSPLIKNLFISCATAYLTHVSNWMFRGQLPSKSEFHITKIKDEPYFDRRFWSKQFHHVQEVPEFLKESWEFVFETGKAVSFLQLIQKSEKNYASITQEDDNDPLTIYSNSQQEDYRISKITSGQNDNEEEDERLDPDKLITTAPPAYSTAHILPSSSSRFTTAFMSANMFTPFSITNINNDDFKNAGAASTSLTTTVMTTTNENEEKLSSTIASLRQESSPSLLNQFLSQAVTFVARAQYKVTNAALLNFYICEKKLFHHVSALHNFLCLQNGLFGHVMTKLLILEIDQQQAPKNQLGQQQDSGILSRIGRLNTILVEAVGIAVENEDDKEFATNLSFTLNTSSKTASNFVLEKGGTGDHKKEATPHISSPYQTLNSIKLCYNVTWPLNVLLTDEVIHSFERIFIFQMQLYRVEMLLQSTFVSMKATSVKKSSKKLFMLATYRVRLLHFVRTIRNYVNVTVIQCAWSDLCASFEKIDSLDKIYEAIVRHIKNITTNCLLGTKAEGVMKLLMNQLVIIETFCHQLRQFTKDKEDTSCIDYSQISDTEFKRLSRTFKAVDEIGKVFVEVAYKLVHRGYYPKVSYFLELYNFNGFYSTSTSGSGQKITSSLKI